MLCCNWLFSPCKFRHSHKNLQYLLQRTPVHCSFLPANSNTGNSPFCTALLYFYSTTHDYLGFNGDADGGLNLKCGKFSKIMLHHCRFLIYLTTAAESSCSFVFVWHLSLLSCHVNWLKCFFCNAFVASSPTSLCTFLSRLPTAYFWRLPALRLKVMYPVIAPYNKPQSQTPTSTVSYYTTCSAVNLSCVTTS